uniref:Importin subunit alpha n=1 Tax=Globodera rostochiensis TaxID=31243 RepID=A0A914ICB1_GLORO
MSSENLAKLYKNAGKSEDSRRRRTETSVELRKKKCNEEMMKRRNIDVDFNDDSITSEEELSVVRAEVVGDGTRSSPQKMLSLEDAVIILQTGRDVEKIRTAFESVRRVLSRNKNPPIDKVIALGFPCALVQALSFEDDKVQFEAAWCITNIVSGTSEQTMSVVKAGAVAPLLKLCMSPSLKLSEQAVWCVANMAGDGTQLRDLLISEGVLPVLIGLVERVDSLGLSFVRIVTWAFSNMCRHKKPQVPMNVLAAMAPSIARLLKFDDTTTQTDAGWALSYLTDGSDDNIALGMGCLPDMVNFVTSGHDSVIAPALRVLGNFVTGNDEQTQAVIDTGILTGAVTQLLLSNNSTFVKECCWLVSNVLAGNTAQIQDVIDSQVLPILLRVLQNGEHRVQYEAANQIIEICRVKNGVEAICGCLMTKNNELTLNMLETLRTVLRTVSQTDPENLDHVRERVEEGEGLDHLETLQRHESEQIYSLAFKIVDEFFSEDEDEGLEMKGDVQPPQQNLADHESVFQF